MHDVHIVFRGSNLSLGLEGMVLWEREGGNRYVNISSITTPLLLDVSS